MNFWTFQPTLNSVLMMLIGLALFVAGVYLVFTQWGRIFGVGLVFTGIGNTLFGFTNGFTDMTPLGRTFYRIALLAYAIGIPVVGYMLFRLL